MYKFIFKKFLVKIDPEKIHNLVHFLLAMYGSAIKLFPFLRLIKKPVSNFAIAAGFDKTGSAVLGLYGLGFKTIEVGTVTLNEQSGNPKPRAWRDTKNFALRNYMGLPNPGAKTVASTLQKIKNSSVGKNVVIGANISKNNTTPLNNAPTEILKCALILEPYIDYFVLNFSCPNTQDKNEQTQTTSFLEPVVKKITDATDKRVYIKISPDLNNKQIIKIVKMVNKGSVAGIIATNTTVKHGFDIGGVSGKPLLKRSLEIVSLIKKHILPSKEIIGCGGIFDKGDINEFIKRGATSTQGLTGFIYNGAFWANRLK